MLENKDIICVSNTTWYGEYTKSTVQLMSRLARNNRVVFVEYPYTIKDLLMACMGKKDAPVKRMLGLKKRLISIHSDVDTSVYNLVMPPVLPVHFLKNNALFEKGIRINGWLYRRALKKVMKRLGISEPIIVNAYNPFFGKPLTGKVKQLADVYYCYDGYDTGRYGDRVYDVDHAFTAEVDAVITTSDYLNNDKLAFNKESYVVKNGVDFDTFVAQQKQEVSSSEKKIVGYIGSLDSRFDIDIVEAAVKQLPDFEFHFTGNLRHQPIKERLEKFDNVKFFGAVGPNDVPALLAGYDVGIIPYTINEYNRNIYPLKINEYLALGVPVVMTAFADLKDFEGMVSVADNSESFIEGLKQETGSDSNEMIVKRREFAGQNSWDNRALEFAKILERAIKSKA